MSRGKSGRIVVEIDPELKRRLYATLALEDETMKAWFIRAALTFCDRAHQDDLFESFEVLAQGSRSSRGRSQ